MSAVEITGLVKRFGRRQVLDGLMLSVPPGQVYGLLGRNGAGKTTLLRTLLGFSRSSSGSALVGGSPVGEGRPWDAVGYVADGSLCPPYLTVGDLLELEASARSFFDAQWVSTFFERFAVPSAVRYGELSLGQRRAVEFGLALSHRAKLLVLDEPFEGMDPVLRAAAREAVIFHAVEHGSTVLVSSHSFADLELLCERVGILHDGRIQLELLLEELRGAGAVLRSSASTPPPPGMRLLSERQEGNELVRVVEGLSAEHEPALRDSGFQVLRPGVETLGVELLRAVTEGRLRHDQVV